MEFREALASIPVRSGRFITIWIQEKLPAGTSSGGFEKFFEDPPPFLGGADGLPGLRRAESHALRTTKSSDCV
jgi:hypothetical protein